MAIEYTFLESVGDKPLKVDKAAGIIYDVKIVGRLSGNRRRYEAAALEDAKSLYEGIYVNVDHDAAVMATPDSPSGRPANLAKHRRGPLDKFAKLAGVYTTDDGLYAKEMRCNTAHPFTPTLLWWAENDPGAVALSHIAIGPEPKIGPDGFAVVHKITRVTSVDVVGNGGTNVSLFESKSEVNPLESLRSLFEGLTDEAIVEKVTLLAKPVTFSGDAAQALDALKATTDPRVRVIVEALDLRFAQDAENARRETATAACKTAGLNDKAVTAVFIESLAASEDAKWPSLIEDRKKLFVETAVPNPPKSGAAGAAPKIDDFLRHVRTAR